LAVSYLLERYELNICFSLLVFFFWSLYTEKIPIIWKDIWGTVRLWVLAIASIEHLLFSSSRLRTADEPEKWFECPCRSMPT
jgi:hypothetical protein